MIQRTVFSLFITICLAGYSTASAQLGGHFDPNSKTISHLYLPGSPQALVASRPDVQHELAITSSQLAKIKALLRPKDITDYDASWSRIRVALSPAQQKRAEELSVQILGTNATLLPSFAKKAKLTPAQTARVGAIEQNFLLSNDKELADSMSGVEIDEKSRTSNDDQRHQSLSKGLRAVLNSWQSAYFENHQGKPFKFNPPIPHSGVGVWFAAAGMH